MKKFIFMIAVLFAATFANAQITLLQSDVNLVAGSNVEVQRSTSRSYVFNLENVNWFVIGDYILDDKTSDNLQQTLYIYDEDLILVKSFTLAQLGVSKLEQIAFISRNIFTNNGEWAWLRLNTVTNKHEIVTESGTILSTMDCYSSYSYLSDCILLKVRDKYLLGIKNNNYKYDVYSLPGNGVATDVSDVSAPRQNARKYLHKDQVLIDSNDKTYTIQGQVVK